MSRMYYFSLLTLEHWIRIGQAVLAVAGATLLMLLIGRDALGEGVIALFYLVPISWSAARWGQGSGIAAAITGGLLFNFFFIPPYYTFYIGRLQGWLLLFIFLAVAILVVGRIQSGLAQAHQREQEAIFSYELSAGLSTARTPQAIAQLLAGKTRQVFQASAAEVFVSAGEEAFTVTALESARPNAKPDADLPILGSRWLEGEIRLYNGKHRPPSGLQDRLMHNFANQGALALERARLESEDKDAGLKSIEGEERNQPKV